MRTNSVLAVSTVRGLAALAVILMPAMAAHAVLVGQWTFENGTADDSGNGHDGTLQGEATVVPDGGTVAVVLDGGMVGRHGLGSVLKNVDGNGGTGQDLMNVGGNRATLGSPPAWGDTGTGQALEDFTIMFWMNNDGLAPGTWDESIMKLTQPRVGTDSGVFFNEGQAGQNVRFRGFYGTGSYNFTVADDPDWHHYAFTLNEDDSQVISGEAYVDGRLEDSYSAGVVLDRHTDWLAPITIFGEKYGGEGAGPVLLDDVRIYDTALSAEELRRSPSPRTAMRRTNCSPRSSGRTDWLP